MKIHVIGRYITLWRKRLQQWLIDPFQEIPEPDRLKQAKLLAFLLLIVIFLQLTATIAEFETYGSMPLRFQVGFVLNAIAYLLSRTRFFRAGALLWGMVNSGVAFSNPRLYEPFGSDQTGLFFLSFSLLLPALVSGPLLVATIGVVNVLGIMLLVYFGSFGFVSLADVQSGLIFNIAASILLTGVIYYRDLIERTRQKALYEHEEQISLLMNSTAEAIFGLDLAGNCTFANRACLRTLGFGTLDNLLGKNMHNLIHHTLPDGTPLANDECRIYEALRQGETSHVDDELFWRADGTNFPAESWAHPILRDGKIVGAVVTFLDISDRKQAEEAVRKSETRYRAVVESQTDLICRFLPDTTLTFVNDACCRYWGKRPEELLGVSFLTVIPNEETRQVVKEHFQSLIINPRVETQEHPYHLSNGEVIWQKWTDYPIFDDAGRLVEFQSVGRDVTERKQAETALRESEERFRQVIMSISDHIYMSEITETGNHLNHYLSPNIETLTGYPTEKLMSNRYFWPASMIHPDDRDLIAVKTERLVRGEDSELEYRLIRADGKVVWVRDSARVFQEGISSLVYGVLSDITKRHQLEEQLRQSQKMEAIGKLTGGIAHDFNNLLTVITGYSEFILHHNFNDPHQFHQDVQQIRNAAERAASLTRQLLAFSRQQILELRVLDLNDTVSNITKMLRRLIGEDIELITILNPVLNKVKADPGQLDQILLNLAVNARDAMPRGGQLTIETANVDLDAAYARRHADVTPGAYVMLAVTDTGAGMDKETQSHIFEPFFTTKEPGKGTGLGLATIYGIVKQSGGHIWVYSEPGQGTMFKIYLPRVDELAEVADRDHVTAEITPSVETVLLVEDEESVRKLAYRILHNIGFNVLNASNGSEALQMCERHQGPIHLLVTDLVMPGGMSGYDLAQRLMPLFPNIKILYMSGYADDSIVHQGVLDTGAAFLQKPFTPEALARKAREVLDERPEE